MIKEFRNVLMVGLEIQCIGHFRLLFTLLSVESCSPIQQSALAVLSTVTRSLECISDIASSNVLVCTYCSVIEIVIFTTCDWL